VDETKNKVERLDAVERFVEKTKAKIVNEGVSAKYVPSEDKIYMPPRNLFVQSNELTATEAYYATLAHELGHWTGHKDRVGREFGTRFGNQTYAFEELIAELSAAFLCAELEITNHPRETHASYIANWLEVMKSDKKAIFTAASYATKAVSYLKNLQAFNL
jgi:antirestriction protein ArdC